MTKYKTETYTKYDAYTSHTGLSLEAANAIEASCYNELPEILRTPLGNIEISNQKDSFIPNNEAYENPGKLWSYCKKSDWYTHAPTGVKVKKEVVKSNNYAKWPGEGTCTTTLTVKIPQPDGRGKNPNSHNNRKIPGLVSKDVRLTEEQWQQIENLGKGRGYSQGVRNLLGQFS